jgi:hypothetical protein
MQPTICQRDSTLRELLKDAFGLGVEVMSLDKEYVDLGGFAASLNSRLHTQARLSKAVGFAWLCGGMGIASCLTACGLALAFLGYSHMISVKAASDKVARALAAAFQRADIKTNVSGVLGLSPESQLRLAGGQTVKLDQSSATLRLDPNSSVRVVGLDVPQPSKEQLQQETTSSSNEIPITDYVVFKSVKFSSGEVTTAWKYDLSDTIRPKLQYCYYAEQIERGKATRLTLAVDGVVLPPSKLTFDSTAAASNCVWFSGL